MNLIERLEEVKKRLGFASEIKSLRPEDWHALLVSIIRDCQRDGAEAEREACKQIAKDFREEVAEASCGVEFYKTACSVIYDRIQARGVKAGQSSPEMSHLSLSPEECR